MKCKLLFFVIASYAALCAGSLRSIEEKSIIIPKRWQLRNNPKTWQISKNVKRADINTMANQLDPRLIRMLTAAKEPKKGGRERHRSGKTYDKTKHKEVNHRNNLQNKLREGYKSFRSVGVRNLPHIKYIARNKPAQSTSPTVKGSQDRSREMYGNLDTLGIGYGKTNHRTVHSVNRKNIPLLRLKQILYPAARKTNMEVAADENSRDFDEQEDASPNEVSPKVNPTEDPAESVASYPQTKDLLVYGSLNNLGIRYGKTNQRIPYTQSRRNTVLETLLTLLAEQSYSQDQRHKRPVFVVFYKNPHRQGKNGNGPLYANMIQADASTDKFDDYWILPNTRRQTNESSSDDDDDDQMASSDFEFNAQNPYTAHRNRYLQNYLWNHKMSGDHMNVNPYAPRFIAQGATAPELFYSRKWWYYNQDDYVPFG